MTLALWQGDFGDSYTLRNPVTTEAIDAREKLWRQILNTMLPTQPKSVLEVGANVGINLKAIRRLLPGTALSATEPNDTARAVLRADGIAIAPYPCRADLVFTSGVLIHIPPADLSGMCYEIHRCSSRWIVAIEYFSHTPQEVEYRGEMGRLWTRDFGSFYLEHFPDLHPIACGFAWKPLTSLDDVTWVVLEKR